MLWEQSINNLFVIGTISLIEINTKITTRYLIEKYAHDKYYFRYNYFNFFLVICFQTGFIHIACCFK